MEWNGSEVPIDTNSITLTSADHKKRNLAWIGGSSAAGALIGGLLGGGKGALIGAGAGGGAGVGTAAATGKRQVPRSSGITIDLPACADQSQIMSGLTRAAGPDRELEFPPGTQAAPPWADQKSQLPALARERADASEGFPGIGSS